jgi:hypothetical protein
MEGLTMDVRRYIRPRLWVSHEELLASPIEGWVVGVYEDTTYGERRPRLVLEIAQDDGVRRRIPLNQASIENVATAWGYESKNWVRHRVRISIAHKNIQGKYVQVRMVSPITTVPPIAELPEDPNPPQEPDDVPF